MSEFIGSRISLVSRSDIRYVGTLHEINSEKSTVALENVTSYGTEGRRGNPDEEIAPSDSTYEYIVFRGSDVKDLRIEEAPAAKENKPPAPPNDPAILGSGSRPAQQQQAQAPAARPTQPQQTTPQPQAQVGQGAPGVPGAPGPQHQQYPPQFYPPPAQWGRGMPPGPGYPGMPYGPPPPGWYPPPPGQGFHQAGPFPYGPYGPFPPGPPPPGQFPQQQKPAPIGPAGNKQHATQSAPASNKTVEPKTLSTQAPQTTAASKVQSPPAEAKPIVKEVPIAPQAAPKPITPAATKVAPTGPKNGRIVPALPLQSPVVTKAPLQSNAVNITKAPAGPSSAAARQAAVDDATAAATAAVAAAMAKLPPVGSQTNGNAAIDNLTKKVNEMRTTDPNRAPRQNNATGFTGRGRGRGGPRQEPRKIEVPKDDFDFESSNAKFNKQDLVKEAIAGSPLAEAAPEEAEDKLETIPGSASYNKKSSFFDDLSSEIKDRAEGKQGGARPGGREWRGEEQKKNVETFGQGSVDNGYRGGYRGRGRGRGGMRGRGYGNGQPGNRSRGGYRGPRDDSQAVAQ